MFRTKHCIALIICLNWNIIAQVFTETVKVKGFLQSKINGINYSMPYKIEPLPDSQVTLGEGPHWDIATQSLYFVDIKGGKLLRYDYQQNQMYKAKIIGAELPGFVIPVEGESDKFAVGCGRRVVLVTWNGVSESADVERTLFNVQQDDAKFDGNRFNDGKCDPQGRLFAGTMRYVGDEFKYRYGELYKWDKSGTVNVVKSNVGISNGLAWNEKNRKFYYIDTTDYEVKEYDYDFENGLASNPRVVFNLRKNSPEDHLLPDGMTIDKDGNIYVATFNGHTVYKVNPRTSEVLLEIKFPCKQITSVAFGGPDLDILYVTTACLFDQPAPAGNTYKVTGLGVQGLPMAKLRI